MTGKRLLTAEDLLLIPEIDCRYELLDGELVALPFRGLQEALALTNVMFRLGAHVRDDSQGYVLPGVGVTLRRNPDRVRAPGVCHFSRDRLPGPLAAGYPEVAPDFVAETKSPFLPLEDLRERIDEWLGAGVRLVWAIYPDTRTVVTHRGLDDVKVYREGEVLDGAPVFAGFSLLVADLFT